MKNNNFDHKYWSNEYEKRLIRFGVISTTYQDSILGNWKWNSNQFFVLLITMLVGIRHGSLFFSSFIFDTKTRNIIEIIFGNTFKPLGILAVPFHFIFFITMLFLLSFNRIVMIQTERNKMLDNFYLLFEPTSVTAKSTQFIMKWMVLILDVTAKFNFLFLFVIVGGLCLSANINIDSYKSLLFIFTSIMWSVSHFISCLYGAEQELAIQGLIYTITHLITEMINSIKQKLITQIRCAKDLIHVLNDVH